MIHPLLLEANDLLSSGGFEYAFCGGFAIDLFLNKTIRKHGDIDVSAFWKDRDNIILYMQSLGWSVFEMCGGGRAHRITDITNQLKIKRNIFCFKEDCDLIKLNQTEEPNVFYIDFNHTEQTELNFIEFLFNDKNDKSFLYARNKAVSLPLEKALLNREGLPYLAPEMVLLYKSIDTEREGYQLDFDSAFFKMDTEQRDWFQCALKTMFPSGHKWMITDGEEFWEVLDENRNPLGRLHKRGKPLSGGEYHLVVRAWIMNEKGQFLITQRALTKKGYPGRWEVPGGSATAGEESLEATIREVKEECGLTLLPESAKLLSTYRWDHAFFDVWLFHHEFDLNDVVLQEGETIDARVATWEEISRMMTCGEFIDREIFSEFDLLKSACVNKNR